LQVSIAIFDETNLLRIGFGLITSARVSHTQERDANTDITRRANHFALQ